MYASRSCGQRRGRGATRIRASSWWVIRRSGSGLRGARSVSMRCGCGRCVVRPPCQRSDGCRLSRMGYLVASHFDPRNAVTLRLRCATAHAQPRPSAGGGLGTAGRLAASQRREVKVWKTDRLFELVSPIARKEDLRHVGLVTRDLGNRGPIGLATLQEFDLVGERWRGGWNPPRPGVG